MAAMDDSTSNATQLESQLQDDSVPNEPSMLENDIRSHVEQQQQRLAADPKATCIDTLDTESLDAYWKSVVDNYRDADVLSRLLANRLPGKEGGIPAVHRAVVWQALAQSCDTHLAAMYDRLVEGDMGISSYERLIEKDVKMAGQDESTARLLKAYSVYDAHVGYCQGLLMLVRPLLLVMDEKQAFCTFVRLMEVHGLRTLFMLNMEGLHLRLHQFQYLLEQQFPTLAEHLTTHGMHPPMYASQWFLTCFVPCLPTNLVVRMYDFVFAQGAILTMMRVALSIMHKHHDKLLTLTTFESLLSHLTQSSLLDKDDDGFTLPEDHQSAVTPAKLDTLAQTYRRQLEDERERAQQLVAVQLEKANNTKKPSRRESWFNWATTSTPATPTSPTTPSSIITTTTTTSSPVSLLHQQIEDLVTALSQLQKEHSQLNETMTAMKLKELDQDNERTKLSKRNAVLEKKIKKYKLKLAQVKGAASAAANGEEDGEHYKSFVNSLRMSGDFGALVATALAQDPSRHVEDSTANKTTSESKKERSKQNKRNSTSGQQQQQQPREMTSELAVVKHANYELNQRYEQLTAQYSQAERDLMDAQSRQEQLNEQLCQLQSTVEQMHVDKEHLLQEHEELAKENEELMEKSMAAKRTQAELEYEKMALSKDMERLNQRIETLEKEKKEYLLPRSSFTEEVFTAHRLLFDPQPAAAATRRPSAPASSTATSHAEPRSEYESKYVESELRCRELEKLLAEAKVKLAEYETANMPLSPRASLHRRTSLMTTVTSPTTTDRRDSAESYASSITSATSLGSYSNTKRSSMYARLWNYTTSANTPARHSIAVLNKQQI